DPENDSVTTASADNYFELVDGFRMYGGGTVGGMGAYYQKLSDPELLERAETDPLATLDALSEMTLYDMEFSFEDKSIVDKAFTLASAMMGQDADTLRSQAQLGLGFAPLAAGEIGIDPAILTELASAASSFLADPGTLTVKLDPETPITAAVFEDPSQITKASLGFSAKSE
ncbi:MAG: hypothetical protein AAGJ50_06660, partial [Pseudomonadota bacterium]